MHLGDYENMNTAGSKPAAPLSSTKNLLILGFCVVLGGFMNLGFTNENGTFPKTARQWLGTLLSFAPMTGLTLAIGVPSFRESFTHWFKTTRLAILVVPGLAAACWTLNEIILGHTWNPYTCLILFASSAACLGAAWDLAGKDKLTWTDMVIWFWLFIPLDLRWLYHGGMWPPEPHVPPLAYDWFATWSTLMMMVAYGCLREMPGIGVRLVPRPKDILVGVGGLAFLSAVVVPVGIAIGFLEWKPEFHFGVWASNFTEIFMTVALTEEMLFRAILFNGFRLNTGKPWLSLFLGILCFGIMHWPRENGVAAQLSYVLEAILSGVIYTLAYWWSGDNLLASCITHALTDSLWDAFLHT